MEKTSMRMAVALEALLAGGYFRKALERAYTGGEKFKTRLRRSDGSYVKGVGWATLEEMKTAGLVEERACFKSSAWPTEWVLARWRCLTCCIEGLGAPPTACHSCLSEADADHGPHYVREIAGRGLESRAVAS